MKTHTNRADIVVRHENFGLLIWSLRLGKYLLPKDKNVEAMLCEALSNLDNASVDLSKLPKTIQNDLSTMGFAGSIRHVKSDQGETAPCDVYFDYTFACNQSCHYCYNYSEKRSTLSNEQISHIINQLWLHGVMRLHLAGGEPTLFPDRLTTYLQTAYENGMLVSINSNGTLLTDEVCQPILKFSVATLTISLDSYAAPIHDALRENGKGSFEKAVQGINTFIGWRNKYSARTKIKTKAVWDSETPLDAFEKIIQYAISLGVDGVKFSCPEKSLNHPKGYYGRSNYIANYYERIALISQLQKQYSSIINIINVSNPSVGCGSIGLNGNTGCIGAQELIAILPDGSVRPCSMNPYILGNLFFDFGGKLESYLRSESLNKYLAKIKSAVPLECQRCILHNFCRGGSKVRSIVQSGYQICKDPLCPRDYALLNSADTIKKENSTGYLNHFDPVDIAHSL